MTLKPMRDPKQCAGREWVAVDTSRRAGMCDPYQVGGFPMVELPFFNEGLGVTHARMFWKRRRDVVAAIDGIARRSGALPQPV